MKDKTIKIIVATHKKYRMPDDSMYVPIHAGCAGKQNIGYTGDDEGDNISTRNCYYSELSAIYWAWKNLDADIVGVSHYRRHFTGRSWISYHLHGKWNSVLTEEEAKNLFKTSDIVVTNKRCYIIETNESHFGHAHHSEEIDLMRDVIAERCPDYLYAYDTMWRRRWAHMFNMFIMTRDKFDSFCTWWFDILYKNSLKPAGQYFFLGLLVRLLDYILSSKKDPITCSLLM